MSDLAFLNEQIAAQILNMYTFDVAFLDAENEAFRLIITDKDCYVWPLFKKPRKVARAKGQLLMRLATNFVLDTDVMAFDLDPKLTYNEFMDEFYNSPVLSLSDFILIYHDDNKAAFARSEGVRPQQITEWINKEFIVVDGLLCSSRRKLKSPTHKG